MCTSFSSAIAATTLSRTASSPARYRFEVGALDVAQTDGGVCHVAERRAVPERFQEVRAFEDEDLDGFVEEHGSRASVL